MLDPISRDGLAAEDLAKTASGTTLPNVTPGEVLRVEYLEPLRISARALARDLGIPAIRITGILHNTHAVTAETAILLGRRFGTSTEFRMNLQVAYDLEAARHRMGAAG